MKNFYYLVVIALLLSCKPDRETIDNTVIIGESHRNYTIIKPDPAILITVSHQDSLDLNLDGIFEIKFVISPIPTITGIGSKTEISTKNRLQFLLSDVNTPGTLSIKSVLKSDSIWSDLNFVLNIVL